MAVSLTKFPTVASQTATANIDWTNLNNALASDNARATSALTAGQKTETASFVGFDFSAVPAGAPVTNINVRIEGFATAGITDIFEETIQLCTGAGHTLVGNNKANEFFPSSAGTDAVDAHNFTTVQWNVTLHASDLDANFGVSVRYECSVLDIINVDAVSMVLTYAELGTPTGVAAQAGIKQVVLTWTGSGGADVDHYQIDWGTAQGGPYTNMDTSATGTVTLSSLTANVPIYAVISEYNAGGLSNSVPSSEVTATPVAGGSGVSMSSLVLGI